MKINSSSGQLDHFPGDTKLEGEAARGGKEGTGQWESGRVREGEGKGRKELDNGKG